MHCLLLSLAKLKYLKNKLKRARGMGIHYENLLRGQINLPPLLLDKTCLKREVEGVRKNDKRTVLIYAVLLAVRFRGHQ